LLWVCHSWQWGRPPCSARRSGQIGSWPRDLGFFISRLESSSPGGMVARHGKVEAHPKPQAARARPAQSRAADLDRLIHEPVRLGIVSALAVNASMTFNDLKELLKTTDGNLSVHARKLEEG